MWRFLKKFLKNEDAATSIEYAMIGGLISIAIVGGATAIGTTIGEDYNNLGDQFQNF
ncbi:MAG: Flp family type IVb pilin [Nitratireductor sp.]|nr:Flp family type IVb pilin [Nitratireductor sp.]